MISIIHPIFQTFLVVAEEGSYNKAGKVLFISPPAVKKQIDQLEAQLGFALFKKSNKGVSLTHSGHELYAYTRKIKESTDNEIKQFQTKYAGLSNTIHIANPLSDEPHANDIIISALSGNEFHLCVQIEPFLPVHDITEELFPSLSSKYDCAISVECYSELSRNYAFLPLYDLPSFCSVHVSDPLSDHNIISFDDLKDEDVLITVPDLFPAFDEIRNRYLAVTNKNSRKLHYYQSIHTALISASEKEIIISLPYRYTFHSDRKLIPLNTDVRIKIGIYYPKQSDIRITRMVQLITEYLSRNR